MNKENQTQQPVSGAMTDEHSSFERVHCGGNLHLTKRNEHGDYVLPSIQDAWSGWLSCAQDAQAIRNAALEEAAKIAEKPFQPCDIGGDLIIDRSQRDAIACAIRKLQSAPAQPVERPDAVELPPMPKPYFEGDEETYASFSTDQMREYALAAIAANQPQQVEQHRTAQREMLERGIENMRNNVNNSGMDLT